MVRRAVWGDGIYWLNSSHITKIHPTVSHEALFVDYYMAALMLLPTADKAYTLLCYMLWRMVILTKLKIQLKSPHILHFMLSSFQGIGKKCNSFSQLYFLKS